MPANNFVTDYSENSNTMERDVRTQVTLESVGALVEGKHENPFDVLGPHEVTHEGRKALAVRAYLPNSTQAWVLDPAHKTTRPMRRIHPAGVYEAICPLPNNQQRYQLRFADTSGEVSTMHDPYSFPSFFSDMDLYLMGEGTHWKLYERMGAQLRTIDGVTGVNFAVWAPNAQSVGLIGDFNDWDCRGHAMRKLPNGIWELFVPGLKPEDKYKYRIKSPHGELLDKVDPYGFQFELPPRTASLVHDPDAYSWGDGEWMHRRAQTNPLEQPVSVYEVHLGSWRKQGPGEEGWLDYRELAHQLTDYCEEMGYTHVELLPVSEHPFSGSWGYQTVGYYGVTSRFGDPDDFKYFVDYLHQNNIGVILDWVPGHFPKDAHGLARYDGTALYEHADPRQGEHPDWGTMIFNYGRTEVSNFLLANALFWLDRYHIDGLRVDAVASMLYLDYSREAGEWIPNEHGGRENLEAIEFLKRFNELAHDQHPGVMTLAEESTAWGGVSRPTSSGGLGFTMKWNMGWMNDTLDYMHKEAVHRQYHHNSLTFSLIYAFTENFILPLSHDEVVHGKGALLDQMQGDMWQQFANLRLLYAYMWTHPGKKLLFMGSDIAQWNEWNHNESLQWDLLQWDSHKGLQKMLADLNRLYRSEPSLYEQDFDGAGFEWLDCHTSELSVLVFKRKAKDPDDFLIVACNFTPVVRENFRIGVNEPGWYREIFNSDSTYYAGSNRGNTGVQALNDEHHGRQHSLEITLPPLGVTVLKPTGNSLE